jgi:hypothetical protein
VICLRMAAVLFFLAAVPIGVAVIVYSLQGNNQAIGLSLLLVTLCFVVGEWSLTATAALEQGKRWARESAIFIFGLCVITPFLPLGAVGLWALISEKGRAEFHRYVNPPEMW